MAKSAQLALLLMVGLSAWAQQPDRNVSSGLEPWTQIRQEFLRAYNAKDVDTILTLYAEDATLVSDGGTFKGRSEIRNWLVSGIDLGSRLEAIEPLAEGSCGTLAYEEGQTRRLVGSEVHLGRYLMVMENIGGEWKITQHFSISAGIIPATQ